jgi:ZIP family zinc transporter
MDIDLGFAILLTALAGLSTGMGSAIAHFIRTPRYSYLASLLGFSAGVMIFISFTELFQTAIGDAGFATANLAFFAGILLCCGDRHAYPSRMRGGAQREGSPCER